MGTVPIEPTMFELLEDLWALRETAASLERMRGVLFTRYHDHPNAAIMAMACHQLAQEYMSRFDRRIIDLLNRAWPVPPEED